ncbi:hypothetical protein E4T48_05956 [Aureobasidium sp. EXF-10727]|nr:hypothetical protein E4T48_05956 [Aureobasidium sp. EXF-10727]
MSQKRAQGQPRQGMLNFITFGEPQQSTSTRAIRSHAAKAGWKSRKNSRSLAAAASSSLSGAGPTTETAPAAHFAPPYHRKLPAVPSWPDDENASRVVPSLVSFDSRSTLSTNSSHSSPSSTRSPHDIAMDAIIDDKVMIDDERDIEYVDSQALQSASSDSTSSLSSTVWFPHQLGSTHDPFSQFPVRWEESFGPLVQFYRNCLGEVWMGLISSDWGQQGNIEFVDFPLQISISQREPAMFYAVLSNTSVMAPASNSISMRQQPFMSQWLRHRAVESLRTAIMDPKRAYTDAVILTVTYVFFNEALRSERHIALNVHGPALKRMVKARGGLRVIASNGKDGLILSRYLSWCDRIIASTLNTQPLFENYVEDPSVQKTQWNGMWSKVQTLM